MHTFGIAPLTIAMCYGVVWCMAWVIHMALKLVII
jgi:hypothetical protein